MSNTDNTTYPIKEVSRLDINLSQLKRNVEAILDMLKPGVQFMAVVKGNAYGHGLVPISKALVSFGCHSLGVVRISEATALRDAGIQIPIVMLAPLLPEQVETAVVNNLTIMVDNLIICQEADRQARNQNKKMRVHIKVNTGLNRFGIDTDEVLDFARRIQSDYSNLEIEGIFTHFRDPEFDKAFTERQIQMFDGVLRVLEQEGLRPKLAHAAASGGILMYPEAQYDLVRCGILLYGEEYLKGRKVMPNKVKPITSFKSVITKLIQVRSGQHIGYGTGHVIARDSRIAIIGAGYGDGISRGWKQVLINGQKADVLNYSMDCLVIDVTDIVGTVKEYDEVVLIGRQGEEQLTWEDACYGLDSEVDEQLQRITNRVHRTYYFE